MPARNNRDIIGGLALCILGLFVGSYAWFNYDLGSIRTMGPGMFPMAVGYLLAIFGLLTIIPALMRPGAMPEIKWRSLAAILGGIAAFALSIRTIGAAPAIVLLTLISSRADSRLGIVGALILSILLTVLIVIIFRYALGIPLAMFRNPL